MISSGRFSGGIPGLIESSGNCSKEELQKPPLAGSGSAVFGVFPSPAMARRAAAGFPHDQTFVCETISRDQSRCASAIRLRQLRFPGTISR